MMNEHYAPLADVHVRRAISYAIDRAALVHAVLFGHGTPANSFMPPQVPYYDPHSPGIQYNLAKAKQEMAESKYPHGFNVQMLLGGGVASEKTTSQIVQAELAPLGIHVTFNTVDPNVEFTDEQNFKYQLGMSYWTMDIADPDELVSFAVDPTQGAKSFYTAYNNPQVDPVDARGRAHLQHLAAGGAVREDPGPGRERRLHGVRVLLAVRLRDVEQGARVLRLPDRQLPHGERLAVQVTDA